jgi:hypothetical protein
VRQLLGVAILGLLTTLACTGNGHRHDAGAARDADASADPPATGTPVSKVIAPRPPVTSRLGTDHVVDVYLSAGPNSAADGGCSFNDHHNCSLYALTVDITTGKLLAQHEVVHGGGTDPSILHSDIDPSGRHLAYLAWRGPRAEQSIRVRDLQTGTTGTLIDGSDAPGERAHFFAWRSDSSMLYSYKDEAGEERFWDDIWQVDVGYGSDGVVKRTSKPRIVMGDGATADHSFADPAIDPANPDLVAIHTRDHTKRPGSATPTIFDLGKGTWVEADMPRLTDDAAMVGCAHPAWDPSGTRISCSEQGSRGNHEIFVFQLDADKTHLTSSGRLFDQRPLEALQKDMGFSKDCTVAGHKYANWCADEDLVVMTVFCAKIVSDDDPDTIDANILTSRGMMVDIADPAHPRYIDLSAALATQTGGPELETTGPISCANLRQAP